MEEDHATDVRHFDDIAVNDNDEGTGPLKQELHWSGMNEMFWRNAQYFGTLILLNR